MARILLKGRPVEDVGAEARKTEMDGYALTRWGCVVIDLLEALQEYMPLRTKWIRMDAWVKANPSHEKAIERRRQADMAYQAVLGRGGSFDRLAKVLDRLLIAHRQLSETALESLVTDYGVPMGLQDHPFFTNLWIDNEITDLTSLLNAWAIATGGHAKPAIDLGDCPF